MNEETSENIRYGAEIMAEKIRLECLHTDRKRAVLTVQKWLLAIGNSGVPLPSVVPDGIYGKETADAVAVFQGLSGITQTGQTDYETWERLRFANKRTLERARVSNPIYPFEYILRDNRLREGDSSFLVQIVQIMIETLVPFYAGLSEVQPDGRYGSDTSKNVAALQRIWQLPQTGTVDKGTWNLLADAYNNTLNRE